MTDAREQLAHLICTAIQGAGDMWIELRPSFTRTTIDGTADMLKVADTILAAGWRAPEPEHEWNEDSCIRCGMRYDQSAGTFCPQAVVTRQERADDDDDEYGEWEKIHPDDDLDG